MSPQAELERKTLSILKKGWMPTSNKNLLTFAAMGVLMFVYGQAAHTLGYTQAQADCKHQNAMITTNLHKEHLLHK
jgi:hypothetical protein